MIRVEMIIDSGICLVQLLSEMTICDVKKWSFLSSGLHEIHLFFQKNVVFYSSLQGVFV